MTSVHRKQGALPTLNRIQKPEQPKLPQRDHRTLQNQSWTVLPLSIQILQKPERRSWQ
jgi:hypothetical protein